MAFSLADTLAAAVVASNVSLDLRCPPRNATRDSLLPDKLTSAWAHNAAKWPTARLKR
jgi:hypothetical protein